jgi:transposase-like protein
MELETMGRHRSMHIMLAAVGEVEGGSLCREVAIKYGICYGTMLNWLSRFGSKERLLKKRKTFSVQQKRLIVRKVLDGEMTLREASLAYGIKRYTTIQQWIKSLDGGIDDIDSKESSMLVPSVIYPDIKKALDQANLKVLALETMIDIAEEQLKIKIRKKSGAKQ